MWKRLFVFSLVFVFCNCDGNNYDVDCKKPNHHHHDGHDVWYGTGILYYLTFLAVKVKIAFIIGGVITLIIFFGKLFALIKYSSYLLDKKDHHHEKIYIHQPHEQHEIHSAPPPSTFHGPPSQSWYSSSPDFDQGPPMNYHKFNSHAFLDSPPNIQQERSIKNTIWESFIKAKKILTRMDLTEMTFDSMHLKSDTCKKKFVCEAEYKAKHNKLLDLGLLFFGNDLKKYRTNSTITSVEDCSAIYPACKSMPNRTTKLKTIPK